MAEKILFKTMGVGTNGEILLGSNQVQEVIQALVSAFDEGLNDKDKRIAELEKALQRQIKRVKLLEPLLDESFARG